MTPTEVFDLLIRHGQIVSDVGTRHLDVGVKDGKICALAPDLQQPASRVIDASNKLVFPGFIDAHTHMGIPILDTHSVDDFQSGTVAAACGGVTTIIDFTVQDKDQMLKDSVNARIQKAQGKCHVDFALHVNVTDLPEMHLWEIPELIDDGFTSFKVFSTYRQAGMMVTWEQFRQVLQVVHDHGGLLMLHAEDNDEVESVTAEFVASGAKAAMFHALSRSPVAESKAIHQAGQIAMDIGAPLYIVHLSSWDGLEAAVEARAQGAELYLETCPQYLVLSEECYQEKNGHRYITTPPLRAVEDAESMWGALEEGLIDVVATDHCPFTLAQKDRGDQAFHQVPNGLPGVETLFPLLYTYGVAEEKISAEQLVRFLAANPAKIFGLYPRKGTIQIGADADLVIWDPANETVVSEENLHGKADWSPYAGMRIAGSLEYTILRGQTLVEQGQFVGEAVQGELLLNKGV
ncbi:MAG: dihydropyrimidinase [bacterium]